MKRIGKYYNWSNCRLFGTYFTDIGSFVVPIQDIPKNRDKRYIDKNKLKSNKSYAKPFYRTENRESEILKKLGKKLKMYY